MRALVLVAFAALSSCRDRHPPSADAAPVRADVVDSAVSDDAADAASDVAPWEDAVGQLLALDEAGVDAPPSSGDALITSTKVTPPVSLRTATASLAAQRFRFRACAKELPDAGAASTVTVTLKVGEGGEVVSSSATPGPASKCLADAGKRMLFDDPATGSATVEITVQLRR